MYACAAALTTPRVKDMVCQSRPSNIRLNKRHAGAGSFVQASTAGHRAEEKGGLREFHAARVNVVLKEIEEGLKMHKSCPSLLKNALAHEVIRGAYAIA